MGLFVLLIQNSWNYQQTSFTNDDRDPVKIFPVTLPSFQILIHDGNSPVGQHASCDCCQQQRIPPTNQ